MPSIVDLRLPIHRPEFPCSRQHFSSQCVLLRSRSHLLISYIGIGCGCPTMPTSRIMWLACASLRLFEIKPLATSSSLAVVASSSNSDRGLDRLQKAPQQLPPRVIYAVHTASLPSSTPIQASRSTSYLPRGVPMGSAHQLVLRTHFPHCQYATLIVWHTYRPTVPGSNTIIVQTFDQNLVSCPGQPHHLSTSAVRQQWRLKPRPPPSRMSRMTPPRMESWRRLEPQ